MSKLVSLFQAFTGDRESLVSIVAGGIVDAVKVAGVHGTQAPLIEALQWVASAKGTKRAFVALREGVKATGLTVDASGKRISAPGLSVGKMTEEKASDYAQSLADAFTLAASTILTAAVDKGTTTPAEKAERAFKALASLTDAQLFKAFSTGAGADILAALARAQAAQAQAQAAASARKALARVTPAQATPAQSAPVTDGAPVTA